MQKLGAMVALMMIALVTFFLWFNRLPPFDALPEAPEMALDDIMLEHEAVTITGTAHLMVKQRMIRPGKFGADESTWWLFPLLTKGDTSARSIHVMALSPEEPDRLAGYEDLTLSGWTRPPAALMTPNAESTLKERGYTFEDDYVVLEVFPPQGE